MSFSCRCRFLHGSARGFRGRDGLDLVQKRGAREETGLFGNDVLEVILRADFLFQIYLFLLPIVLECLDEGRRASASRRPRPPAWRSPQQKTPEIGRRRRRPIAGGNAAYQRRAEVAPSARFPSTGRMANAVRAHRARRRARLARASGSGSARFDTMARLLGFQHQARDRQSEGANAMGGSLANGSTL